MTEPRTELQALYDLAIEEKRRADERPARFEKLVTAEIERMRREVPGLISQKGDTFAFSCNCGDVFGFRPATYPPLFFGDYDRGSKCPCCVWVRQRIRACHEEVRK